MRCLHIVPRLEILHFEHGWRKGVLPIVTVAVVRIAVDQPHQLSRGQVGRKALKALRYMGFPADDIKHRQQLAHRAGIDIARGVARIHGADKIVVDGQPEDQVMRFLQLAQQRQFLDNAAMQCFLHRVEGKQQVAVQLFRLFSQMLCQHEKHCVPTLHIARAAAEQIVTGFQIAARILRQRRIAEYLGELIAVKGIGLIFAEVVHVDRVDMAVQQDGVPLAAVAALEQRHHVAPAQRVVLQILHNHQLGMRCKIRDRAQIFLNRIRNVPLSGGAVHARNGYQAFCQCFDFLKQFHSFAPFYCILYTV